MAVSIRSVAVQQSISKLADCQGWNGLALGDLAWSFIMNSDLCERFREFLLEVAAEENSWTEWKAAQG